MISEKHTGNISILGGGPAGYVAAIRAAQLGAKVILIEENELGGVCLNRGCIPTKALLVTSEVTNKIRKSKEFGIDSSINHINYVTSDERKNRIVKNLNMGLEHLLNNKGVTILHGKGRIVNPNTIIVTTSEGESIVQSDKVIITAGSRPFLPNIKGMNIEGVLTSDEALNLKEIPQSLVIIGAGAIGLEFATLFSSLGCKVTIIEMKDKILPNEDKEITDELFKIMKRQGINFKLSATVKEIISKDRELDIIYSEDETETHLQCEKVLVAIGRKINSDSEDFKNLGLNIDKGAIVVNENMETNIKGVYAAGDVIGGSMLAHLAFMEGKAAAENALGIHSVINYDAVPACVYTNPEVASVGVNETEARTFGMEIKVGKFNFRNNGRALTLGEREGFVKIITDKDSTIIGGQIIGANASEMISEVTLAITMKAKANILADMIHPHPSLNEAVWEACADAIGRAIHKD